MDEWGLGSVTLTDPQPGSPGTLGVTDDLSSISPGPIDPNAGWSLDSVWGGTMDNPVSLTNQDFGGAIAGLEDPNTSVGSFVPNPDAVTPAVNSGAGGGWSALTDLFGNLTKVAGSVAQGVRDVTSQVQGQPSAAQVAAHRKQSLLIVGALAVSGFFLLRK